ncbi:MAG: PaaI family thioesterase [Planctomycetes bacterium]|nr:PaaI family thioesterase [Planctomycetota bacterium]
MSRLDELLREARERRDPAALVQAIPYSRFIGLSAEVVGGELLTRMAYRDHLIGNSLIGALHGGTLGSLLESAAVFTLLLETESTRLPKIIGITVEYLRTARPLDTLARAEFTRLGRRIACVRAYAWQEDRSRPVATATANFLLAGDERRRAESP